MGKKEDFIATLQACYFGDRNAFNKIVSVYDNLQQENKKYKKVIDKAVEYIENHSLYEEEYDYDYEENSYLSGIDDETAKKDLLEILKDVNNG